MDNLINDFSLFVKQEFNLDVEPRELKKIIGNNTVMFKTFQIIMLKFKSKNNGEIIKKQLELDEKRSKLAKLMTELNVVQSDMLNFMKAINERMCTNKNNQKLIEFYEFKEIRIQQLIKLVEQILKSTDNEANTTINLNKIDKNIDLLNLKVNLDEIDEKYLPPPQINYNLVEKQIDEFIKDINGSIYELTELMKNEDFVLELEDDFVEKLTRTDYDDLMVNEKQVDIESKTDKRLNRLKQHFEKYKVRRDSLCKKHQQKVTDLIKTVDEQIPRKK